jgi:hypothetical protein
MAHLQLERQSLASFGGGLIEISKISCTLSLWCLTMVANTTEIVICYEERVRSMPFVPRLSHGRRMLRSHDFLRCIVNIFRLEFGASFFFNTMYHDFFALYCEHL